MRLNNILQRLSLELRKRFSSPESYARYLGVHIGDNCLINIRDWGTEPYLICIGNNVQITRGVSLLCHGGGHAVRWKYPEFDTFGKIVIEDWCYIGSGAQIMPGVVVGYGSLVASGSIVTKSVPPYSVVAGNPARIICSTDDYVAKNIKFNLNTKRLTPKEKRLYLLNLPEDKFVKK